MGTANPDKPFICWDHWEQRWILSWRDKSRTWRHQEFFTWIQAMRQLCFLYKTGLVYVYSS